MPDRCCSAAGRTARPAAGRGSRVAGGRRASGAAGPACVATCAALVNELVEAADERTLAKTIGRYARLDLLCCDELGYLHLDPRGAELLFQVITEREERPASRWPPTPRSASGGSDLHRSPTGRRRRRPAHLQRPHHPDRHPVLPAPRHHQPQEGSRHQLTTTPYPVPRPPAEPPHHHPPRHPRSRPTLTRRQLEPTY